MSKIKKKFISFGTGTDDVNSQSIPANFTPTNYTPTQVGSETTAQISAHLKGLDIKVGQQNSIYDNVIAINSNTTLTAGAIHIVDTTSSRSLTLPSSPVSGTKITIKDASGQAAINNISLVRASSESIEGVASTYILDVARSSTTLVSDSSGNWFII